MKNNTNKQYYKMQLDFTLSLSLKPLNELLELCNFNERTVIKDAITVSLTQTVPFIPAEENIEEYAEAIKVAYNEGCDDFVCENCHFVGYKYLLPVEMPEEE